MAIFTSPRCRFLKQEMRQLLRLQQDTPLCLWCPPSPPISLAPIVSPCFSLLTRLRSSEKPSASHPQYRRQLQAHAWLQDDSEEEQVPLPDERPVTTPRVVGPQPQCHGLSTPVR